MTRSGVLIYGDQSIPYSINDVPSRTTRVAIHVEPDGRVIVDAPPEQPDDLIARAVRRRARWVSKNVEEATGRLRNVRPKSYASGEEVLYLGRRYMLKVIPDPKSRGVAKLKGNRLEVRHPKPTPMKTKVLMRFWYRDRATDYFRRRMNVLSIDLPWVSKPPGFRLLEMNRQWGSCSPQGEIVLNPHLIKAPKDCIDYVLIHELAHLKHHSHGAEFWKLINTHCSGWQSVKHLLDLKVEELLSG